MANSERLRGGAKNDERLRGGAAARRTASSCGGRAEERSGRRWSGVERSAKKKTLRREKEERSAKKN